LTTTVNSCGLCPLSAAMGMVQRGQDARLACEARQAIGVTGNIARQDLDGESRSSFVSRAR
jgi:hypothetical protein